MRRRRFTVLLAEDDEADVELIRRALAGLKVQIQLVVASDGEEALRILRDSSRRPDLLLLDINMPRKSGFEVVQEVRNDPRLRLLPVVMLTTSDAESDIAQCYERHANCFVTKPVGLDEFDEAVRLTLRFWLELAQIPSP